LAAGKGENSTFPASSSSIILMKSDHKPSHTSGEDFLEHVEGLRSDSRVRGSPGFKFSFQKPKIRPHKVKPLARTARIFHKHFSRARVLYAHRSLTSA
jgi:hypothetical protein